ncbi:OLC1v1015475C1 [Oldenlandia corymbosa var. corymbosa]|uniref:OLC1v1015475C1 n=1 Tax=Oldenlandia corymbosa var. corymbosa TaxID=529605 RepID=A0AAV1E3B5_OLDCO|nr:OLC1v1015475C1 [Oldenlandia corymbosa var. corymbosa]
MGDDPVVGNPNRADDWPKPIDNITQTNQNLDQSNNNEAMETSAEQVNPSPALSYRERLMELRKRATYNPIKIDPEDIQMVMGEGVGFNKLMKRIWDMWQPSEILKVIDFTNDFYGLNLANEKEEEKALRGGPWPPDNSLTVQPNDINRKEDSSEKPSEGPDGRIGLGPWMVAQKKAGRFTRQPEQNSSRRPPQREHEKPSGSRFAPLSTDTETTKDDPPTDKKDSKLTFKSHKPSSSRSKTNQKAQSQIKSLDCHSPSKKKTLVYKPKPTIGLVEAQNQQGDNIESQKKEIANTEIHKRIDFVPEFNPGPANTKPKTPTHHKASPSKNTRQIQISRKQKPSQSSKIDYPIYLWDSEYSGSAEGGKKRSRIHPNLKEVPPSKSDERINTVILPEQDITPDKVKASMKEIAMGPEDMMVN